MNMPRGGKKKKKEKSLKCVGFFFWRMRIMRLQVSEGKQK